MDFVTFMNSYPLTQKEANWGRLSNAVGGLFSRIKGNAHLGRTLSGAFTGSLAGSELPGGEYGTVRPFGVPINIPGAIFGGILGNRVARHANPMHSRLYAPYAMLNRAGTGAIIGGGIDTLTGQERPYFSRLGAYGGLAAGTPALFAASNRINVAANATNLGAHWSRFRNAARTAETTLGNQFNLADRNMGHYIRKPFDWLLANRTPVADGGTSLPPLSRLAAISTAAGLLAPSAREMIGNTANRMIGNTVGGVLQGTRNTVNNYIENELPERLTGAVGRVVRDSGGNLLRNVGIDTSNMAPWQQWALYGGGGAGLLGLLTGNDTLSTLGGGAMAASFLPQLMRYLQQYQQQQSQQRGQPNAAAGTLPTAT